MASAVGSQPTACPTSVPSPKVMAAASMPSRTCRPPVRRTLEPVTTVIAAPTSIKATALTAIEATTAPIPDAKMKGESGTIAPRANRIKM